MDDKSFNIRVPKKWARYTMVAVVTALIVAPLTAIAAHSFTDVPDTHTFHADIDWLKDAGVTKGCNPPANTEFCPDDDVTRGQMSAFMHRFAQFIGAADGTPAQADNADTVDGKDAADLTVAAAADIDSGNDGTTVSVVTTINDVTITAPVEGVLLVNGSAFVNVGADIIVGLKPFLDGAAIGAHGAFDVATTTDDDSDELEHLGYTTAVQVSAGTYTVSQAVGGVLGDGSLTDASVFYNANNLTVTFVPNGTATAASVTTSESGSLTGD